MRMARLTVLCLKLPQQRFCSQWVEPRSVRGDPPPMQITYTGDPAGPAPKTMPCPSISAPAGEIMQASAQVQYADLSVPDGSSPEMIALGKRIYHGQVGGPRCTGCHGESAKGTTLGPDLTKVRCRLWVGQNHLTRKRRRSLPMFER